MAEIGKYYVQIVPSAQGIGGNIEKAIAPNAKAAGTSAGHTIAQNIGSSMQKLGGTMMKAGAIATAVSVPIIAGIKKALNAYSIQNAAETKLVEIYKTRMGASKKAAQGTMKVAAALQKEGIIGDEVLLSGAQQLATFAKYPGTVNKILPAMGNLIAQQKGTNATTQDATQIANLMGKAMQGQVGALKRVGISFSEAQAEILKTGTEEEKAAVLAEVVTENVGEMNKALAETPSGKIQQMKNSFGDLTEQLGAALAPVLQQVAEWVSARLIPALEKAIGFMQSNPIISKIVLGITALLAVGGPLLVILGTIVSSVGALLPLVAGISAPVLAVAAAVAAVGVALMTAYTQSASFRSAINSLVSVFVSAFKPVLDSVIKGVGTLIKEFIQTVTVVGTQLAPVIKALMPVFKAVAKLLAGALKRGFDLVIGSVRVVLAVVRSVATIFRATFGAVVTIVSGAVQKVKSIFSTVKNALTHPFETAKNAIKGIVDKIKGFFGFSVSAPHVPLPHFGISPPGWKIGDLVKGKIPSLSVSWYAQGGIMKNGPTLFGGGENGDEAIVPLDPFWKKLDKIASTSGDITINVYGAEGQSPKAVAEEVKRMLIRETNQRRLAW